MYFLEFTYKRFCKFGHSFTLIKLSHFLKPLAIASQKVVWIPKNSQPEAKMCFYVVYIFPTPNCLET